MLWIFQKVIFSDYWQRHFFISSFFFPHLGLVSLGAFSFFHSTAPFMILDCDFFFICSGDLITKVTWGVLSTARGEGLIRQILRFFISSCYGYFNRFFQLYWQRHFFTWGLEASYIYILSLTFHHLLRVFLQVSVFIIKIEGSSLESWLIDKWAILSVILAGHGYFNRFFLLLYQRLFFIWGLCVWAHFASFIPQLHISS